MGSQAAQDRTAKMSGLMVMMGFIGERPFIKIA
jgi:hypothetical protein